MWQSLCCASGTRNIPEEQPQQWPCFALVQNPYILFQVHTKSPEKWDFNREAAAPFLPLLLLCLRQLQQQIPFPAAPKKDTNTSRDVKNLLYAGVHSMAKSTYRLMPCMEPRWTHTKLELIPSSRVFPLFSIILHSE